MSERRQERKVVTVLFCDLVSFTSRAEEMDPEDVATLLTPYHARVKAELERYGGIVEKFIGDAVMALFGAPVAHEDDPERAVRAALAIRDYAEDEGIELRLGIATGEALVTLDARPDQGETMATGDVVNTAARLQSAAPVNGVLVSGKTHDATRDRFEYRDAGAIDAKGKSQPVSAHEAVRARSRITLDRLHGTPLVGRSRELDLLVGAFQRTRAERQPQLVTLVGVPGIGKSRLVYELSQVAARDPELISWRQGRCLPYGDGVTFWALGEIVKAQLGVLETDTPEQTQAKLLRAVLDEWIRDRLQPLLGIASAGRGEGDLREEAFLAWRRFLEDVAAQRPLVVVFEDLHWADENLLDFVDHLVDWVAGVALLVVCSARPELLERRPAWGGGKTNALTISLSPLSDEQTARLVAVLTDRAALPADVQEVLLQRAGGNPFYAEQYAHLLRERVVADLALPETVQGLIAARLDLLEPSQKGLLQDAAVVGKGFWLGALVAISGVASGAAERDLHSLERKGFVRRERESSIEGDTGYAFVHVLVREVAYGQIPRIARAERHRRAAEWIESLGRPDDHAEMLAYHYGQALTLARAAGADTESLEEPARRALRAAGDRAFGLNTYATALRFYERALETWPQADRDHPHVLLGRARAYCLSVDGSRVDLLSDARERLRMQGDVLAAAEAGIWESRALRAAGRTREAIELRRLAAGLVERLPRSPTKALVLAEWARGLGLAGKYDEQLRVARRALAIADELDLDEIRASSMNSIGLARLWLGDVSGLGDLEESLRLATEYGSPLEIDRSSNNLAWVSLVLGQTERAEELQKERLAFTERAGLQRRWVLGGEVFFAYWAGRWDEAARVADEFLAGESPHLNAPTVLAERACIRLARDDETGAAEDCRRGLELLADNPSAAIDVSCARARLALAEGAPVEARQLLERLSSQRTDALVDSFDGVIDLALLLDELGRPADFILSAAEQRPLAIMLQIAAAIVNGRHTAAADRLAAIRMPMLEARVRLRAAERLVGAGRRAEADAQLDRALAFWRSVGAARYVRDGEALLAATG